MSAVVARAVGRHRRSLAAWLIEAGAGKTSDVRIAFAWYLSVVGAGLLFAVLVAIAD